MYSRGTSARAGGGKGRGERHCGESMRESETGLGGDLSAPGCDLADWVCPHHI